MFSDDSHNKKKNIVNLVPTLKYNITLELHFYTQQLYSIKVDGSSFN